MSFRVPALIKGCITFGFIVLNTLLWCVPLILLGAIKFLIPLDRPRKILNIIINECSTLWITANNLFFRTTLKTKWEVNGTEGINPEGWYLVISNHQSWIDVFVLQYALNYKIPFLKFFVKKELIWLPVAGLIWWAQDLPFMKRYSKEFIEKNPHLKGQDLAITRKACEKFSSLPVSVTSFIEGTRFTPEKKERQQSPFTNLIRPKAGGMAFVLSAMGHQLNSIVNVTIAYPGRIPSFWDFLSGKVADIKVHVDEIPIDEKLRGNYFTDEKFKATFQVWINELWEKKDKRLCEMLGKPVPEIVDKEAA